MGLIDCVVLIRSSVSGAIRSEPGIVRPSRNLNGAAEPPVVDGIVVSSFLSSSCLLQDCNPSSGIECSYAAMELQLHNLIWMLCTNIQHVSHRSKLQTLEVFRSMSLNLLLREGQRPRIALNLKVGNEHILGRFVLSYL